MEVETAGVLIIDTAWIGDVIFSTALISAVNSVWPECPIDMVVAPRGEAVLRDHALLRKLIVFDKAGKHSSVPELLRFGRALNANHYKLVLCAHPSFRSRLLTALINAPARVGFQGFGETFAFTHSTRSDLAAEPDHVKRRLGLLQTIGVELPSPPQLNVTVTDQDEAAAEELFSRIEARPPFLGIIAGSAWETKRWKPAAFAEIAQRWQKTRNGSVLVIAGRSEQSVCDEILMRATGAALALVQEPLTTVRAVLKRCEATVGNDTGLTYLALAAGCPKVVALYGSTQINYAFPAPHISIHAGVPCCLSRYGHGKHQCRWKNDEAWCMEQLNVHQVWDACSR